MANVKDITRESWILSTFPEWGTWLNEEIEEEVVPKDNFAMWWLGNCGVWIKTPGGANIVMDLWSNRGKSTKKVKDMVWGHQMANMAGVRKLQPNLRVQPMVIDPFAINELDYYLVSHFHSDHIDINTAAAIVNNPKLDHVKFVGPYECGEIWKKWGVPEDRIIVIKPGDSFEFKDVKVTAVESFDRTCLVTLPVEGAKENDDNLKGLAVTDEEMARKAVNYVFETPGGTILMEAHQQLEELILDRATYTVKKEMGNKFADVVYEGKWFTPLREAIQAFIESTQQYVTGEVKFKLYKGNIIKAGTTSPYSLYSESLASFTTGELYDHHDAEGFINLFGLSLKVRAMKMAENDNK